MPQADAAPPALFLVEVRVADWPRARRWYAEVLGLTSLMRDDEGGFALLGAGPGRIALKADPSAAAERPAVRLTFEVPDLDAARALLIARGAAVGAPTDRPGEGYREIRLADPEGTPITLFSFASRRARDPGEPIRSPLPLGEG